MSSNFILSKHIHILNIVLDHESMIWQFVMTGKFMCKICKIWERFNQIFSQTRGFRDLLILSSGSSRGVFGALQAFGLQN